MICPRCNNVMVRPPLVCGRCLSPPPPNELLRPEPPERVCTELACALGCVIAVVAILWIYFLVTVVAR